MLPKISGHKKNAGHFRSENKMWAIWGRNNGGHIRSGKKMQAIWGRKNAGNFGPEIKSAVMKILLVLIT